MGVVLFHQVFAEEIEAIAARRRGDPGSRARNASEGHSPEPSDGGPPGGASAPRPPPELEDHGTDVDGRPITRPTAASKLIGLALSGGGVRSAAFCLGALQALDEERVL